ncbi:HD-GYP domain-containing protein [Caldicellulosiruptor changbaiensis]|uniref:HD-GYP domain-containing protein n=1 Tax=Caldicellulosiruptor changbaiensis TaxID=1222016 RepID=A0A3T0D5W8_9FIRM|nr:HD-GYP domain-containing protein [Caldicellulosiruptor changbaiensis]AZT90444.1 HD-GYP domain-containing protein [Caldicellulosiruptor changbaiensis]
MRRILLKNAKENMVLAKDIYSEDGKVLVASGQKLTNNMIKRLKDFGVYDIYIVDDNIDIVEIEDVITKEIKEEAFKVVNSAFSAEYINTQEITPEIKVLVSKIISQLLEQKEVILNLCDIRTVGNYTLFHSLNTTIFALLVGIKLNYDYDKLLSLGMGTLLHDIGKVKIPRNILSKRGPLQEKEYEMIKMHTIMGYDILNSEYKFDQHVSEIALYHHERLDGSGYPFGKTRDEIPQTAKIVAVVDVFDALVSDREFRKRLKPHMAIEYLLNSCSTHFDSYIVSKFVTFISLFQVGTPVILNTREKGIVVHNNPRFPSRPIVRIFYDSEGRKLPYKKDIDLALNFHYYIVDVLEDIEL